jgi:hypothetical protein
MRDAAKLLLDETPLVVLPSLVAAVGLHEAIVLQQLHYLIAGKFGKIIDGQRFIYKTYEQWRADYFPFWHADTVRKTFRNLEKAGYVVAIQEKSYYRQKLYAINYEKVNAMRTNSTLPSGRFSRLEADESPSSIQREDYTKTTADANAPANATIGVASISVLGKNVVNSASLESESENKVTVARLDVATNIFNHATKAKTAESVIRKWNLPVHLQDICLEFAGVFGIEADGPTPTITSRSKKKWAASAAQLYEIHPTHAELIKARDVAAGKFPISHPGAAVNTIINLRAMNPKPAPLTHAQPVVYREKVAHDDE